MKNTIVIDTFGNCACACVTNVCDGTENIFIIFETDSYINPKIELDDNSTTTTYDLEIVNGFARFTFPYSIFDQVTACKFRYIDDEKTGAWFQILGIYGGTVPRKKTMRVIRVNDYMFSMYFVGTSESPVVSYNSNNFDISEDGELSLSNEITEKIDKIPDKSVTEIAVTTDTDDVITNVTLKYDDSSASSNACQYDSDGNLIKFGDLVISGW